MRHKYNAVCVDRDGFKLASKKEGTFYDELKISKQSRDCMKFLNQVPFRMRGSTYLADFMVFWKTLKVCAQWLTISN